jgi:hypothetical protein
MICNVINLQWRDVHVTISNELSEHANTLEHWSHLSSPYGDESLAKSL